MLIDIFVKVIIGLCGLANLLLAFYVYRKNTKDRVNINFFYFGATTALWCFTNLASMMLRDLFWLRATYSVSCILALTGVFFTYALANKEMKKWLAVSLSAISIAFFIAILFTPLLIESITSFTDFGFETVTGPLIHFWEFYFFAMVVVIVYVPLRALKKSGRTKKKTNLIFSYWRNNLCRLGDICNNNSSAFRY